VIVAATASKIQGSPSNDATSSKPENTGKPDHYPKKFSLLYWIFEPSVCGILANTLWQCAPENHLGHRSSISRIHKKLDALEQTTDSNAQKEQDFSDIVFDLKMQASDMCAAAQSDSAALEKVLVKLSTFLRDWIAVLGQELLTPSLDGLTAINLENLQNLASVSIQSNQWDSVAIELQAVAQQKSDVDHTKQNIANLQPLLSTVAQLEQAWELAKKNALQLSGYYGPLNV